MQGLMISELFSPCLTHRQESDTLGFADGFREGLYGVHAWEISLEQFNRWERHSNGQRLSSNRLNPSRCPAERPQLVSRQN